MSGGDFIALAWTMIAAVFEGFALHGLLIAREDRIESERAHDAESAMIVESRERRQVVRVVGFLLFAVVGIIALLPIERGPGSFIAVGGLFVGMIALGIEDVLDQIDRISFRRIERTR